MQRCDQGAVLEVLDDHRATDMADFFKMVGDPGRLKILYLLRGREICVQHLAKELNMSPSAVSHQLRLLRQQRLVSYVKDGKKIYYTLDDHHIEDILNVGLAHIEHE